jgi:hypothetical protein
MEDTSIVLLVVVAAAVAWFFLAGPGAAKPLPLGHSPSVTPGTTSAPQVKGGFADLGPGAPVLAPLWKVVKPLAPVVQAGIADVNKALGTKDFAGAPTNIRINADGSATATDASGCTLRWARPGTNYTRDCGSLSQQWDRSNVKHAIDSVGHGIASGVKASTHAVGSAVHKVIGWL